MKKLKKLLSKIQIKRKRKHKIRTNKDLYQGKKYDALQNYEFPYMKLSQFNNAIFRVIIKEFRLLLI